MNGLCGWLGDSDRGFPAEAILRRMASGLQPGQPRHADFRATGGAGLHLGTPEPATGFHAGSGVWAAIDGVPVWSEPELAAIAEQAGSAAALVEAYRRFGTDLFRFLRGAFALALLDHPKKKALLAIDRWGIQTMCFSRGPCDTLVFGTTTDCVRAHPAMTATVSPQAIYHFLYFWQVPAPDTIYEEQGKLLPGQYLVWDGRDVDVRFYWRMPYRENGSQDIGALGAELRELLSRAVSRAVAGADASKIGSFLSGGLDSSTITGLLGPATRMPARSFTIAFAEEGYDETRYARIAADRFGASYKELRIAPKDFFEALPALADAYDEPFGNSSVVPAYCCARFACEAGIDVMLAGDGGDELFAGNAYYLREVTLERYRPIASILSRVLVEPALPVAGRALGSRLARKARSFVEYTRTPLPDRLESKNFFATADLSEVFEADVAERIVPDGPLQAMREVYERTSSHSPLQRMLHLDLKLTLADADLRKVTRTCQLAGVRVRFPFLDDDVAEFSARVSPSVLVTHRTLRHFYKRAFEDFLPPEIISKPKHGFGMPTLSWIKQYRPLEDLLFDSAGDFRRRHYVRADFIDRLIDIYRGATSDTHASGLLGDIMVLEQWLQSHVDRSPEERRAGTIETTAPSVGEATTSGLRS